MYLAYWKDIDHYASYHQIDPLLKIQEIADWIVINHDVEYPDHILILGNGPESRYDLGTDYHYSDCSIKIQKILHQINHKERTPAEILLSIRKILG